MYILPHFDVDFQTPPVDKVQRVRLSGYPFDCRSITLIYHPRNLSFIICNVNGLSYIKSRSQKKSELFQRNCCNSAFLVSKANMYQIKLAAYANHTNNSYYLVTLKFLHFQNRALQLAAFNDLVSF